MSHAKSSLDMNVELRLKIEEIVMNELELKLTLPEINQVLEALGAMPYRHVYQLITKIQQQAQNQLQTETQPNGSVSSATAIEQRSER